MDSAVRGKGANRIVATIEARMSSSRLPGKVLLPANGKPMLLHLIERLRRAPSIDAIVVATTAASADEPIVRFAESNGITCFRGSEKDVMDRVIGAARSAHADIVVEITGDCPLIDPDLVEQTISVFLNNDCDYAANSHLRSYPDGMDVQVFRLATLEKSAEMTNDPLEREHVSLHIRRNPGIFRHANLVAPPSLFWPELGLTLDERSDYDLLTQIVERLAPKSPSFGLGEILDLLRREPELLALNAHVRRKGDT